MKRVVYNCKKGFTLIEVLVSLAVVGSLVVALYSLLYHMNLYIEHEDLLKATLLAREKLYEEPLQRGPEQARSSPDDRFSYRKEIINTPFQGIKLLRITVQSNGRDLITMERLIRLNE